MHLTPGTAIALLVLLVVVVAMVVLGMGGQLAGATFVGLLLVGALALARLLP